MGKAGGLCIRAWWEMGGEEWLLLGTMWSVSPSLGVRFCHRPSYPLTIVYTVNASTSHTFRIFHNQHGVYV